MTVVNCSAQSHEAVSARYSCDPMSPCHRELAAPKRPPALKSILRRLGVRCRQSRPGRHFLATFKEEHPRTYKDDQQAQSISWDSFATHSAHEIGCISCAESSARCSPGGSRTDCRRAGNCRTIIDDCQSR